jgi:hypothetical protein
MENIRPFIESAQIEIILTLSLVSIILFFLLFITMINLSFFKSKYKKLNKGTTGMKYDEHILENKNEIKRIKTSQNDIIEHIDKMKLDLTKTYTKLSLYKYNAFENQGGKMSFILVLLNSDRDGVILHNIHNNDFTYLYAKKVSRGTTEETLTKEEKEVLLETINK